MQTRLVQLPIRKLFPSLRRYGFAVDHFPCYRHSEDGRRFVHDVLYGSLLLGGTARHEVAGSWHEDDGGCLTIVGYGIPHAIITPPRGVEVFNLFLDPERHPWPPLPPELVAPLGRLLPLHRAFSRRPGELIRVSVPDPAPLAALLLQVLAEQRRPVGPRAACMSALATLVLTHIAEAVDATRHSGQLEPLVAAMLERIEREWQQPLTIDDLTAGEASSWHASRRFTAALGIGPMRWLRERRLTAAMAALRSSDQRILDIALASGFNDLTTFNRAFKAIVGTTPRLYRHRLQSEASSSTR